MKKAFISGLLVLIFLISFVSAYTTPVSDFDMKYRYGMYNATNINANGTITASYLFGNGQGISNINFSGIDASNFSVNYSQYTNISNLNVNTTTLNVSNGFLNIVVSFFTNLFYQKSEVYTMNETDALITGLNGSINNLSSNVSALMSANASTNSRIDSVNSSVQGLISSNSSTNSRIDTINLTVDGIQSNISGLISSNSSTNGRVDALNLSKRNVADEIQWSNLTGYPVACPANTFMTQVGDSITCTSVQEVPLNFTADQNVYVLGTINESGRSLNDKYNDTAKINAVNSTVQGLVSSNTTTNSRIDSVNSSVQGLISSNTTTNGRIDNLNGSFNGNGAINWTQLQNYPVACPGGSFVSAINDTITCTAVSVNGTGGDGGGWTNTSTTTSTTLNVSTTGCMSYGNGGKIC
jgi:outer membrane murein-binding lipoprotein Lpp